MLKLNSSIPQGRIEFVHLLRAIAAILVWIAHYITDFWNNRKIVSILANAPELDSNFPTPWLTKKFLILHPNFYGSVGVSLFFIISGFVIPFSLNKVNWRGFLIARFLRIYPTYICGLSITIILISISSWYFNNPFPYSLKEVFIQYCLGLRDFFQSKNIDGIIWTLEIELKFYLICVLIGKFIKEGNRLVFLVPVLMSVFWVIFDKGYLIHYSASQALKFSFPFLIYMFIGVAANFYYRKLITLKAMLVLWVVLFAIYARCMKGTETHFINGYFAAIVIFAFSWRFSSIIEQKLKWLKFAADISYPFYVIHGVAGYAAMLILLNFIGYYPLFILVITTIAAVFLSYLVHKYIEVPTNKLGKKLSVAKNPSY